MVYCLSVLALCLCDLAKTVWLSIIRRNRTKWSLIGPVILWTITQNRLPRSKSRIYWLESSEKYNYRLSIGQDVLLPISLLHLEPSQECVCDGTYCSITRDFKVPRRDGNANVAWKVNLSSFTLYRDFSYPLSLSNVGEPNWSWIPIDISKFQKRNKISPLLVTLISPECSRILQTSTGKVSEHLGVLGKWLIWKQHPINDFNVCRTQQQCQLTD